jgi:hypothetical protein
MRNAPNHFLYSWFDVKVEPLTITSRLDYGLVGLTEKLLHEAGFVGPRRLLVHLKTREFVKDCKLISVIILNADGPRFCPIQAVRRVPRYQRSRIACNQCTIPRRTRLGTGDPDRRCRGSIGGLDTRLKVRDDHCLPRSGLVASKMGVGIVRRLK